MTLVLALALSLALLAPPDRPVPAPVVGRLLGLQSLLYPAQLVIVPDGSGPHATGRRLSFSPEVLVRLGPDVLRAPVWIPDGARVRATLDRWGWVERVDVLPWWSDVPDVCLAVAVEDWVACLAGPWCVPPPLAAALAPLGADDWSVRERVTAVLARRLAAGDVAAARALAWGRRHRDPEVRRRCELVLAAPVRTGPP